MSYLVPYDDRDRPIELVQLPLHLLQHKFRKRRAIDGVSTPPLLEILAEHADAHCELEAGCSAVATACTSPYAVHVSALR